MTLDTYARESESGSIVRRGLKSESLSASQSSLVLFLRVYESLRVNLTLARMVVVVMWVNVSEETIVVSSLVY